MSLILAELLVAYLFPKHSFCNLCENELEVSPEEKNIWKDSFTFSSIKKEQFWLDDVKSDYEICLRTAYQYL